MRRKSDYNEDKYFDDDDDAVCAMFIMRRPLAGCLTRKRYLGLLASPFCHSLKIFLKTYTNLTPRLDLPSKGRPPLAE